MSQISSYVISKRLQLVLLTLYPSVSWGSSDDDDDMVVMISYICMTLNNACLSSFLLQNYIIFLLHLISLLVEKGKCLNTRIQIKRNDKAAWIEG